MADINVTQDANLTTNTAPALADRLLLMRNSDSVVTDITPDQLMKIIALLTADTTPASGDSVVTYDTSASLAKQVLLSNLHKALTTATDSQAGTIELATNAETLTGTDTARAVTPDDLAYVGSQTGWIPDTNTWTYASADDPTFTLTVAVDLTSKIGVGDRIKLTQTTAKYFIVTVISYSAPNTTITIYGGTDYDLANAAITSPFYSHAKAPFGFPVSPAKWTVEASSTSACAKASPAQNTWYGGAGLSATGPSIDIPIGAWRVEPLYNMSANANAASVNCFGTLSTANNSESDVDFTAFVACVFPAADASNSAYSPVAKSKTLVLAAKTTYYINIKTSNASQTSISINGDLAKAFIRAICAYL